jgi:hypothetical protein
VFYAPQDRSGSASLVKGFGTYSTNAAPGPARKSVIPVRLGLVAEIKFFGRHKGGWIRDGVILSVQEAMP